MQKLFLALALILLAIPAFRADDERFLQETEIVPEVVETTETIITETEVIPTEVGENGEGGLPNNGPQTTTPVTFFPTALLNTFAVDVHYYSGLGLNTSHIAYHFCYQLVPEFIQCDLYDGIANTSRLIGIELVATAEVLQRYPVEERRLWYSNSFQILSGIFVFPNLSPADELELLGTLVNTYSKTIELYAQNSFEPTGVPQLTMGWINEAQVNQDIVNQIDTSLNLTTTAAQRATDRANLQAPQLIEGANDFLTSGLSLQYQSYNITVNQTNGEPIV